MYMEHIVRPGETLAIIANTYGVTVPAIMHANRLQTDLIQPGQRLFIPHPAHQYHMHTHTHIYR
jgi:N-acetylmuramoyl-L-alanine amidase